MAPHFQAEKALNGAISAVSGALAGGDNIAPVGFAHHFLRAGMRNHMTFQSMRWFQEVLRSELSHKCGSE